MMGLNAAIVRVRIDGQRLTGAGVNRILSVQTTEKAGAATDQARLVFANHDRRLAAPRMGAEVDILLGRIGAGVATVFEGVVDDAAGRAARGQGTVLEVQAKGADLEGEVKRPRRQHLDDATLEQAMREFGRTAGITDVLVHAGLAGLRRDWWGMDEESFLQWGQAIARETGATFRLRRDQAIIVPRGAGVSVSGKPLQAVHARYGENLINWHLKPALGRPSFGDVRARFYDFDAAKWQEKDIEVLGDRFGGQAVPFPADDGDDAEGRAGSEGAESKRKKGGGTLTLVGEITAAPEAECVVSGTAPGFDGTYVVDQVTRDLTRGRGFTSTLMVERPETEAA